MTLLVLGKCVDCRCDVRLPFYDLSQMFGKPVVCAKCSAKVPFREEIVGTRWPPEK